MSDPGEITRLLIAARDGKREALDLLVPMVYGELERMARRELQRVRGGSMDAAGLIGELYLRLVDQSRVELRDRAHFFAYAAKAMRRIVIDWARRRAADKRGGDVAHVPLEGLELGVEPRLVEALAFEEALTALGRSSERQASLVELRFFAGLGLEECATVLGVSEKTVRRDWQKARAFLYSTLRPITSDPTGS